jgi:hypothetical protein
MSKLTAAGENGSITFQKYVATTTGVEVPISPNGFATAFQNNGGVSVWVYHLPGAFADAVTAQKGWQIGSGGDWTDAASVGPWYLYSASSTANVTVARVDKR